MGLGQLFRRDVQYVATDTDTGATDTFTIITDPGLIPDWSTGAYRGGMGLPGAWRSALLIADLLGGVPWHAYVERAGISQRIPTPPLLTQPNPPETRINSLSALVLDLLWDGNAVGIYSTRDSFGEPTTMVPVPADQVGVRRADDRDVALAPIPLGTLLYTVGGRTFLANEVLHVKGPCKPGDLRGMGVLENHMHTLQLAGHLEQQARAVDHHGVPTGVLKSDNPDLTPDEAKAIKQKWIESQRTRSVAVLNASTSYESLAWNPTETQLLEARRFTLHEIALIFGIDASWLGVANDSQTYQNTETKAIELLKFSMNGHLARFEQALSLAFRPGVEVRANLDAVLRADTLTRYQAHQIGITAGFLTDDEARAMENRPPLTPAQREQLAAARTPPAPPAGADDPDTDPEEKPEP